MFYEFLTKMTYVEMPTAEFRTVGFGIIKNNGRILLRKHLMSREELEEYHATGEKAYFFYDELFFPGGQLIDGELRKEGLKRVLEKQLNADVDVGEMIDARLHYKGNWHERRRYMLHLYYSCAPKNFKMDDSEALNLQWVHASELPRYLSGNILLPPALGWYLNELKASQRNSKT